MKVAEVNIVLRADVGDVAQIEYQTPLIKAFR
jgi:hypothetical protein